jgi:hypothetical protein
MVYFDPPPDPNGIAWTDFPPEMIEIGDRLDPAAFIDSLDELPPLLPLLRPPPLLPLPPPPPPPFRRVIFLVGFLDWVRNGICISDSWIDST